jgi:putative transposase
MYLPVPYPHIFHLYNRSNDRRTLFPNHFAYVKMLRKMENHLAGNAHILGYCLMPNHFHILISPIDAVPSNLLISNKSLPRLPTPAVSEAVRRILMGYTQWFNRLVQTTGSRFQQHTRCRYHSGGLRYGLEYLHLNPVKANLVGHPSEWGYSSFNEYYGPGRQQDAICNVQLGTQLYDRLII